jgi:hypothetical protein
MDNFEGDDVPFPERTFANSSHFDEVFDLGSKFLDYNPKMGKTTQVNAINQNINSVRDYKTA